MRKNVLYIIGNGFDLHHNIPSSYNSFGEYVLKNDPALHETFERYFSFEGNWASFEETLAYLDLYTIIDDASNFLVSYAAEDWSDAYHHDYQYEVNRIVEALSEKLKKTFTKWVCELNIPNISTCQSPLVSLDTNAKFLTFNYTRTLQKLYQISSNSILHIHNEVEDLSSDLILGHGVVPSNIEPLNHDTDEDQDVRVTEASEILNSYFSRTFKPTAQLVEQNAPFFSSLAETEKIVVIGHSLSEVDLPYFQSIERTTRNSSPNWIVTYYSESSISGLEKAMSAIGVPAKKVTYTCTADLQL